MSDILRILRVSDSGARLPIPVELSSPCSSLVRVFLCSRDTSDVEPSVVLNQFGSALRPMQLGSLQNELNWEYVLEAKWALLLYCRCPQ